VLLPSCRRRRAHSCVGVLEGLLCMSFVLCGGGGDMHTHLACRVYRARISQLDVRVGKMRGKRASVCARAHAKSLRRSAASTRGVHARGCRPRLERRDEAAAGVDSTSAGVVSTSAAFRAVLCM